MHTKAKPMRVTKITFRYPNPDPGMYTSYTLNGNAPESGDYAHKDGIIVRTDDHKATLCTWDTVAYCITPALEVSPDFRRHIQEALDRAAPPDGGLGEVRGWLAGDPEDMEAPEDWEIEEALGHLLNEPLDEDNYRDQLIKAAAVLLKLAESMVPAKKD